MSFVHPELAIMGAVLAVIPVVIHWLHRRRFVTQPWAAMDFILAAYKRSRRRLHFEHWLLLAVRVLAILLLGLAAARPFARSGSLLGGVGQRRSDKVVIVDNGFSMRARGEDGETNFEKARKAALQIVENMEVGERVAIVCSATPEQAELTSLVSDRFAAMKMVERLQPSWMVKDWEGAMKTAEAILGYREGAESREIVILTDLAGIPEAKGEAGVFSQSAIKGAGDKDLDGIVIVNVGGARRENLAVTALTTKNQLLGKGIPIRVSASVSNFGSKEHQDVRVTFAIDRGKTIEKKIDKLGSFQTGQVEIDFVPEQAGGHVIIAKIPGPPGDVIAEDNQRELAMEICESVAVLMIDGRINLPPVEQELFYYRTALESRSGDEGESGFKVKVISPAELGEEMLRGFDVIVLGNVKELTDAIFQRLDRYVQSGGGLVVFCGDRIDAERYRAASFLPAKLNAIVQVEGDQEKLGIRLEDLESPILSDFLGQQRSILGSAMAHAYWKITKNSQNSAARILLRLTNSDPLVLTSVHGRGRTIVWLSGANLAWTNLPARPDFVPLALNMTAHAADADNTTRNVRVGQSVVNPLRDSTSVCEVQRPDKSTDVMEEAADEQASHVYGRTDVPGIYRFRCAGQSALAGVHTDERASDLREAEMKQISAMFGEKAVVVRDNAEAAGRLDNRQGAEAAPFLAMGLLILLGCESMMAHRFGNRG